MPRALAHSSEPNSTQAAPSVSGELLPAVSVPALLLSKAVLNCDSFSRDVSPRTLLSFFSPQYSTTRSLKNPARQAASALRWLLSASSSCSRREIFHCFALSSQCWPIDIPVRGSPTLGGIGLRSLNLNCDQGLSFSENDLPFALFKIILVNLEP